LICNPVQAFQDSNTKSWKVRATRLETLEIIAAGLNAQLMLIPDDKVHLIRQLLNDEIKVTIEDQDDLMTNPWKGLLGGEEP
jgi:hypothetical protein